MSITFSKTLKDKTPTYYLLLTTTYKHYYLLSAVINVGKNGADMHMNLTS